VSLYVNLLYSISTADEKFRAFGVVMLHFKVEETNPWGFFGLFFLNFWKSQFLFFSDIPEFQVGSPVNQQIKNMWPYSKCTGKLDFTLQNMKGIKQVPVTVFYRTS
jgi:hypothetical protein